MIFSWENIGVWAIGVLGTTVGNLITLAIVTSITSTKWFKNLLVILTEDFNNIVKARAQARARLLESHPEDKK